MQLYLATPARSLDNCPGWKGIVNCRWQFVGLSGQLFASFPGSAPLRPAAKLSGDEQPAVAQCPPRGRERLSIVCHNNPDCLASALALGHTAAAAGIDEQRILYSGDVTHQRNRAFVNLLDIDLKQFEAGEKEGSRWTYAKSLQKLRDTAGDQEARVLAERIRSAVHDRPQRDRRRE